MRRTLSVLAALAAVLAGVQVAGAGPAAAAPPVGGTYVPLAKQARVASSRLVPAGRAISVHVAGVGRLPRSGVGAVVVTVTASRASTSGGLTVYGRTNPRTTNLQFARGRTVTDTAVVPVSHGRIHVRNAARRGSVRVSVDVSGYYRAGSVSSSAPGVFHTLPTARHVVTVRPHAGASFSVAVGGHAGVPSGAGAAAVTLTVSGATRAGAILAHRPDEPRDNLPIVRFAARRPVSTFAVLRLSGGRATLVNTSSRAVRVRVDAAGWYVIGFAQSARTFQTLVPTRIYSARAGVNRNLTVPVAGRGGVPLSGVVAVLVEVHATRPSRSGGLQAWRYGVRRPRSTTVLQFAAGQSASNEVLVPVSAGGRIALRNVSRGRTGVLVDVHGYVPSTSLTPPTAYRGRYLSDLTGTLARDMNTMAAHGCSDGATGSRFVLLDLGAQSVTGRLAGNPGVSLAKTASTVRYNYTELESLLSAYLARFSACAGGRSAEIAIGTNNDGVWHSSEPNYYAPTARGKDWADFIAVVSGGAPAGLTIAGADDMEPGFDGSMSQTIAWKNAYVARTGLGFVFNGSADGCPVTWTKGGHCAKGWTAAGLYSLASGTRTRALPQIYFGAMATQWAMIDATGGHGIRFVGALQQPTVTGSLSAGQAWTALTRAVSSVTRTPVPRVAVSLIG